MFYSKYRFPNLCSVKTEVKAGNFRSQGKRANLCLHRIGVLRIFVTRRRIETFAACIKGNRNVRLLRNGRRSYISWACLLLKWASTLEYLKKSVATLHFLFHIISIKSFKVTWYLIMHLEPEFVEYEKLLELLQLGYSRTPQVRATRLGSFQYKSMPPISLH